MRARDSFATKKKIAQTVSEERREVLDLDNIFSEEGKAWQECVSASAIVISEQNVQENNKQKRYLLSI